MTTSKTINAAGEAPARAENWRHFPPLTLTPILKVALSQFVEHGYDATTVRAIAKEVGFTVPALYYHYENKQKILMALLELGMETVSSHLRGALHEADVTPVARFAAVVEASALYTAYHRDLAFLDFERRALTPENLAIYVAHRDRIERELRASIIEGAKDGIFGTPDPRSCARAIMSMCQGIANWYRPDGPDTPEGTAAKYIRIALAAAEYSGTWDGVPV